MIFFVVHVSLSQLLALPTDGVVFAAAPSIIGMAEGTTEATADTPAAATSSLKYSDDDGTKVSRYSLV